jgi:aldose 1-epimerase
MPEAPFASRHPCGTTPDGTPVDIITLVNARGVRLQVLTRGAVIRSLRVPDRDGVLDDVVLGYDSVLDYVMDDLYIGAAIGRYANRIRNGRFALEGRAYELPINQSPNHLHGGPAGFHTKMWHADIASSAGSQAVSLTRTSTDGEEGYPGNLVVDVVYTLTDENELIVEFRAATDQATPINLTQHSYFNLRGAGNGTIHDHVLSINAEGYLPIDETSIPLGHIESVANSPFDFTKPHAIGARIAADHAQIQSAAGFDHCYVLRGGPELKPAAQLYEPETGRTLEVLTTEPGMQLYTGQFLKPMKAKDSRMYGPYSGLCLETQHFPDSPNQAEFPSVILRPGERYDSKTVFRFSQFY